MIDDAPNLDEGRSARKHREILDAALNTFLTKGYERATMDDIAAVARVSKQTVYKHFVDKDTLFADIVLGTTERLNSLVNVISETLTTTSDLRRDLERLGDSFLTELMQPDVLRLRRLVISSADRFPEVGRSWYQQGFERVLATLTDTFQELDQIGLLRTEDPGIAAHHFVGMLLWIPLNKAMFTGATPHRHRNAPLTTRRPRPGPSWVRTAPPRQPENRWGIDRRSGFTTSAPTRRIPLLVLSRSISDS